MDLSDDCVSGYATELPGDLACAQTVRPELFELFYALIRPTHQVLPCLDRHG
jgi:hypothetical protein